MKNNLHLFLFILLGQFFCFNTPILAQTAKKKTSQKYSLYYCNNSMKPDTILNEYINYDEKERKKEESSWSKCHTLNYDSTYFEYKYGTDDRLETQYTSTRNRFSNDTFGYVSKDTIVYYEGTKHIACIYQMSDDNDSMEMWASHFMYEIDSHNRIIQTYHTSNGNFLNRNPSPREETNYIYNGKGLIDTQIIGRRFRSIFDTLTISNYSYNTDNQCIKIDSVLYSNTSCSTEKKSIMAKKTILYTYNAANKKSSETHYIYDVLENTITYTYNSHNDLIRQEWFDKKDKSIGVLFWKHEYW